MPFNEEQCSPRVSMNTSIPDYDSQGARPKINHGPKQEKPKTKERGKKSGPDSRRIRWKKDQHNVVKDSWLIRDHGSDVKECNARQKKHSSDQKDHTLDKEHNSDQKEHRLVKEHNLIEEHQDVQSINGYLDDYSRVCTHVGLDDNNNHSKDVYMDYDFCGESSAEIIYSSETDSYAFPKTSCSIPEEEPYSISIEQDENKSAVQQMNSDEEPVAAAQIPEHISMEYKNEYENGHVINMIRTKRDKQEYEVAESIHPAESLDSNQLSEWVNDSGGYRIADMIRSLPDLSMIEGRRDSGINSGYALNFYTLNLSNTNNTMNTVNSISEPRTPTELPETERFPEVLLEALKRLDLEGWKMLASHLRLDRFIDGIESEAKNHHESPTQLLLNKWYQIMGRTPDKIPTIKEALEKMGRRDVLDALEDKEEEWDLYRVTVEDCEE